MSGAAVVDGYAHCSLARYRPVDDLLEEMGRAGVSKAILVQALGDYDNRYIAEAVRQSPSAFAGVALIDPFDRAWATRLSEVERLGFRGLRFRAEWLVDRMLVALAAAWAGMSIIVYVGDDMARAVDPVRRLAREAPATPVVVSHLGAPRVRSPGRLDGSEIAELARESNVWATLSGLSMFAPHPHAMIAPAIAKAVQAFGPERLMWGSNFPVGLDVEPYGWDLELIRAGAWGLAGRGVSDVVGGSAARLWFPRTDPTSESEGHDP